MTAARLKEWRAFCEWLGQRPRKCAHRSDVPSRWKPLVYVGGNPTGERAREERHEVDLIFYYSGWGWRLRKRWRERLAELEKETNDA
ncbi:MAG TPA: hypothetical protein VN256_08255 [Pyrinomonadaceae bacterium]|nr:hypothetical protein [Pyrinomonadaceae bacterium]